MMIDPIKQRIRNTFNRSALTYDQYCAVQNTICRQSIQLLLNHQKVFDSIADFGCGTGESTRLLVKYVDFNHCYAMDFAERLLAIAQKKLSHISKIDWIQSDFDHAIKIPKPLELIFCNMGLQWSSDISKTIKLWHQYLNDHGLIVFSIPLAENFPELKKSFTPIFLNHNAVVDILKINGWHVVTQEFKYITVQFNNQFEALKALKATGANYNKSTHYEMQGLSPIKLDQIFVSPNLNQLTYEIGIYLARKVP